MTANLNDVYKAIGSLETEVVGLRRDVQEDAKAAQRVSDAAAASRSELSMSIAAVDQRTKAVEGKVEDIIGEVANMKIVTDQVTQWRHAGMGALAVTGLAAGFIGWVISQYWAHFLSLLRG